MCLARWPPGARLSMEWGGQQWKPLPWRSRLRLSCDSTQGDRHIGRILEGTDTGSWGKRCQRPRTMFGRVWGNVNILIQQMRHSGKGISILQQAASGGQQPAIVYQLSCPGKLQPRILILFSGLSPPHLTHLKSLRSETKVSLILWFLSA